MKKPHAHWLTVHKADIDPDTSIEILWETVPNTLKLLLFRIDHGSRSRLVTEEIGPFRCLAELRHQLCVLFGELSAQRVMPEPVPMVSPAGIPAAPANSSSTVTLGIAADDRGSDLQPQVTRRRRGIAPPSEATRCLTTAPPTSKSSH